MNEHELFMKAANHLLNMKERSFDKGMCRYRGPDGAMCPVGAVIPDVEYDPSMEDNALSSLVMNLASPVFVKIGGEKRLVLGLIALQDIHDNEESWWREGLTSDARALVREVRDWFQYSLSV